MWNDDNISFEPTNVKCSGMEPCLPVQPRVLWCSSAGHRHPWYSTMALTKEIIRDWLLLQCR